MATISVFFGSTRTVRHGDHVAEWISKTLESRGHTVHRIDPNKYEELLVLRIANHHNPTPSEQMQHISSLLKESSGFILVSPEYNHSYSGAIKNSLDSFMPEYKGKPFAIATYSSSSFGGIRANEALRPVVSELKGVPTPLPLVIPSVKTFFDGQGKTVDPKQEERLAKFLDDFEYYVRKLGSSPV
jgi:NAD(P)H-dependent FMN reductase